MKVLYDFNGFETYVGGVSKCMVELIQHLPEYVEKQIAIEYCNNIHFHHAQLLPGIKRVELTANKFITKRYFPGKYRLYSLIERYFPKFPSYKNLNRPVSIEALNKQDFDVFHCPGTSVDMYFLDYLKGKPFVLTVHDMTSEKFFPKGNKQSIIKQFLVPKASHIIVVSEKTKFDLMEMMRVPEDKITVIYHGTSAPLITDKKNFIDEPYFLYVGNRLGYKNFNQTLVDFAIFHKKYPDVKFVVSGNEFTPKERYLVRKLGLCNVVINFFASEYELANLYQNAKAFIYPSLYEGFGLPILESFSYECPVLLNDTSCFPEIAQDAALYFHSRPDEGISNLPGMLEDMLLMSTEDRSSLIEKGKRRAQFFSWKIAAEKMAEVYKYVLNR